MENGNAWHDNHIVIEIRLGMKLREQVSLKNLGADHTANISAVNIKRRLSLPA
jgi:hypothetical protein